MFAGCDALFKFIGPQNLSSIGVWVRVVMVILYCECRVPHIGGPFWVSWCAGQFNLGVTYKLELFSLHRYSSDAIQSRRRCSQRHAQAASRWDSVAVAGSIAGEGEKRGIEK